MVWFGVWRFQTGQRASLEVSKLIDAHEGCGPGDLSAAGPEDEQSAWRVAAVVTVGPRAALALFGQR